MVNDALRRAALRLKNSPSPLLDARVLMTYAANSEDALTLFRDLTPEEAALFEKYVDMRAEGIPVSYIVGEKEFMGYGFHVNSCALIPRPDTECLVERVLEKNSLTSPKILDLCTGSGCVGISLALLIENSTVDLTDISVGALSVAKKNILRHNLSARARADVLDVLNDTVPTGYDIITANPPYIASETVKKLEVSRYEPLVALDGGDDGLDFYRIIIKKAYAALFSGGMLALEIGYDQGESVPALMNGFSSVSLYRDYGGNNRVVIGIK